MILLSPSDYARLNRMTISDDFLLSCCRSGKINSFFEWRWVPEQQCWVLKKKISLLWALNEIKLRSNVLDGFIELSIKASKHQGFFLFTGRSYPPQNMCIRHFKHTDITNPCVSNGTLAHTVKLCKLAHSVSLSPSRIIYANIFLKKSKGSRSITQNYNWMDELLGVDNK